MIEERSSRPRSRRFGLRIAIFVVVGVCLAWAAESGFTWLAGPHGLPVGNAHWIWAPRATSWTGPVAFLAIRDFDLDDVPGEARLVILADEEYVAWLNDTLVGSGRYRPGDPLDAYSVAPLLKKGRNRLLVELRSGRGLGGFFANLHFPGTSIRDVGTDDSWRMTRMSRAGIMNGNGKIAYLPPARDLGAPPFGRWGPVAVGRARELLSNVIRKRAFSAPVLQDETRSGRWVSAGRGGAGHIPAVRIDFGREVEGLLVLGFSDSEPEPGLLYLSDSMPDPDEQSPAALVMRMRGGRYWMDVEMRRFRYAVVLGMPDLVKAQIYRYRGTPPLSWRPVPLLPMRGVFGLRSPLLRSSAEDEVWRKLQGLASGG